MLKPLEQFFCDKCGEIIEKPEDGRVEWMREGDQRECWGIKIIHNQFATPNKTDENGCSHYEVQGRELPLTDFTGKNQIPELLKFLDLGSIHEPDYKGIRVRDVREFVEFMRRLTIEYYEEARKYWGKAESNGYFDGANEISVYLSDNLRILIERYQSQ